MRILNTKQDPQGPTDDDIEALRRLIEASLGDPDKFIIISVPIEIDPDGHIIIKKKS